jgi:hypothetical protein
MNERQKIALAVLALVILSGVLWMMRDVKVYDPYADRNTGTNEVPQVSTNKESMVTYVNVPDKILFEYPSSLYIKEKINARGTEPKVTVTLVKNIEDNVDFIEGRTTDVREGPTAITLDIYDNPKNLSPKDWVIQSQNWNIATSQADPITVAGERGVSYTWSGLYEGRSVVLSKGNDIFVFSVTYMDQNDQMLKDFEMVLNSAAFTD